MGSPLFAILNSAFFMIDHSRDSGIAVALAANLRRLRIARRLSLSELARATSMSKATLSGIENGKANPTVETLAALAAALRVSVVELLQDLPLGEVVIVRAAHAGFEAQDGVSRRSLASFSLQGTAEITEISLDAGERHEFTPQPSGTRIDLYVLQGTLIAGPVERITELGVGDFMSFPGDEPYAYETGRRGARALLVTQTTSALR
jgi:transcriptional regulator with XRE-family HTH domain